MKHFKLTFPLFLCLAHFSAGAQDFDSTLIQFKIEGIQAGKMKLVGTFGDQNFIADSAVVDAAGGFEIRRKGKVSPGFYTLLLPGQKNFSILVDTDTRFSMSGNIADIVNSVQVSEDGLNTKLLYENFRFQTKQDPEFAKLAETMKKFGPQTMDFKNAKDRQNQLLAERKAHLDDIYKTHPNSFFTIFKIAGQNPDPIDFRKPNGDLDTLRQVIDYRARFWKGIDWNDTRLLHTPVIANKLRRYIKELTPQNPDSLIKISDALIRQVQPHKQYFKFFANWIALQYENTKTNVMDGEAVYVHVIKNFITKELAFWSSDKEIEALQKHAWEMEPSLLNRQGPDVVAKDVLTGQNRSIYEMKSPLVVIFMFSPDCEHCQKEAPDIKRISDAWKSRGIEFYGIGLAGKNPEDLPAFVRKHNFGFPVVHDPTNKAIYAKYFVDITPELYILNKDRKIIAKNLKSTQLEEVFERELKKVK